MLGLSHCEGHLDTAAAVADGRTCPEIIFDGTLRMGAMAADVRVRDSDCALSRADCTVTGGRRNACAAAVEEDELDTPIIFSILKDGLADGSDLIMDAVLRLLSC